jgi:lysophospholipase L1-like esterase
MAICKNVCPTRNALNTVFPIPARRRPLATALLAAAAIACLPTAAVRAQSSDAFALKSGDKVVFYGDSITDQRQYTIFTEDYVVTRFPTRDIRFVHSGWGGDRVTGGGGGPIDLRLDRDVVAYKPSVVTIMLGMNDASYRAYDEGIFQTYANGYQHMVSKLKKDLPGVRLTLIQPSPFDDVTRPPTFEGGYNSVLVRYGAYIKDLAAKEGATVADLNTPVVAMLEKANAADNATAQKILPDRVHPGPGGHLIMAEALLKAWNAPALVSAVTIDAQAGKGDGQNARVEKVSKGADGTLSWTAKEDALPFPLDNDDPAFQLALKSSDFVDALDKETLTVTNLAAPSYTLKIDGQEVGTFTKEDLAAGVNLAPLPTPMQKQAQQVRDLTRRRSDVHNARWRQYQVPMADDKAVSRDLGNVIKALDGLDESLRKEQRAAAQPQPHTFTLTPKG